MRRPLIRDGQYNIGHICTRQQCDDGYTDKVAMRFLSPTMERTDYTFGDLEQQSNKFANILEELDIRHGEIIFTFLPKTIEQFVTFLGGLKRQVVVGTLFSNFGEEALLDRLGDSQAKVIITRKSYLKKILHIRDQLPKLKYILLIDNPEHQDEGILSYPALMKQASRSYWAEPTSAETPSVIHYTSGSTGKPKGVLHLHRSILSQEATAREILQLGPEEIFWCTADQGWVTGTSYGIIGPWSLGVTQIHYAGAYDAEAWFNLLQREGVTIWYTAPTALRMLMREDPAIYQQFTLPQLKHIFSVGEPLNPEIIYWSRRTIGFEIYDTWFQTETGAIMISNRPGLEIRPGSMGKPVPGITAAILDETEQALPVGARGNLCLKTGWPSMFSIYLNNEQVYRKKFIGEHYFSGDTAYLDQDGYFWFTGRSDDVINTAGHLISPFEIESVLLEVEEVAESGVVGAPDDILFEKVVAYICLKPGYSFSPELELKIRLYVSNKLSSIATPQEMIFVESIPKNKSGKIMRRVLKAWYSGTDTGDLSTLEV